MKDSNIIPPAIAIREAAPPIVSRTYAGIGWCAIVLLIFATHLLPEPAFAAEPVFVATLWSGEEIRGVLPGPLRWIEEGSSVAEPLDSRAVQLLCPGLQRRAALSLQVKQWIEELGAPRFAERHQATRQLLKYGADVRCELEQLKTNDPERQERVEVLMRKIAARTAMIYRARTDQVIVTRQIQQGRVATDPIELKTEQGVRALELEDVWLLRREGYRGEIDLLSDVELPQQAIRGNWRKKDGVLVSPGDRAWALLQFRLRPPPSYRIEADVQRMSGSDALIFPIVVGSNQCNVCIDGWPRGSYHHTGIELINGKGPPYNSTRHAGDLLKKNTPAKIRIEVTPRSVTLQFDNRRIFQWQGDSEVFSMQREWTRPDETVLGIGSYEAEFHIQRLTVTPIVEDAALRPPK